MAGTVGAIFNSALQFGSSIGSAAATSISVTVDAKAGVSHPYAGRAASFWFLFALVVLETISVLLFFRPQRAEFNDEEDTSNLSVPSLPMDASDANGVVKLPGDDAKATTIEEVKVDAATKV